MKKFDLNSLKTITPPPPSHKAKYKALKAAQIIFEEELAEKNIQGKSNFFRLIYGFIKNLWRQLMKKQLIAGTAIGALTIATITFIVWDDNQTALPPIASFENNEPPLLGGIEETLPAVDQTKETLAEANHFLDNESKKGYTDTSKAIASNQLKNDMSSVKVEQIPLPSRQSASLLEVELNLEEISIMEDDIAILVPNNREKFPNITPYSVKQVSLEPVSTFSIDVDTSSYAYVRSSLNDGYLPSKDAIRTEELINYFNYNYPLPANAAQPFKPSVTIYPTPWNEDTKLLHIGIKGYDIPQAEKAAANLVFLIDTSGSMNSPNKLPLLKNAFRLLVENLNNNDTISIVAYAGSAGIVLQPTKIQEKRKILNALEQLQSGGSTAGGEGIKLAYSLAEENFNEKAVNRVILATDGDFNVGISDSNKLKNYIERKRETGVFLSVLGFGRGNYNDELMQALAQNGNGNAAYIDTLNEAQKVLVDEAGSTLFPIAKDVKIQIEFNPQQISEYRLIGYETRHLNQEDFNNDKVDAGDIGSGHSVTAIYEITPVGSKAQQISPLRYQNLPQNNIENNMATAEYAFLKIRYKQPKEEISQLIEFPIHKADEREDIEQTTDDVRFATAVAAFAQLLRNDVFMKDFSYDDVIQLAKDARGDDEFGYRSEFLNLVRLAKSAKKF